MKEGGDKRQIRSYKVGRVRINVGQRTVVRDGEVFTLHPRSFDTLLFLIQNRGRILEKDEVMKAVWRDVVVEEGSLVRAISDIRKAFGVDAHDKEIIETISGRGYRFNAIVKEESARTIKRKILWIVSVALFLTALAIVIKIWFIDSHEISILIISFQGENDPTGHEIKRVLQRKGFNVEGPYPPWNTAEPLSVPQIRYFYNADKDDANQISQEILKELGIGFELEMGINDPGTEPAKSGSLEIWIPKR